MYVCTCVYPGILSLQKKVIPNLRLPSKPNCCSVSFLLETEVEFSNDLMNIYILIIFYL